MKLITEMYDDFEVLSEGKNGKDLKIKGVFMQAETKNRNGRMYPLNILQKEVNNFVNKYKRIHFGGMRPVNVIKLYGAGIIF